VALLTLPQRAVASAFSNSTLVNFEDEMYSTNNILNNFSLDYKWWNVVQTSGPDIWTKIIVILGAWFFYRIFAYYKEVQDSLKEVQEIIKNCIDFEGDGNMYDNVTENGSKFSTNFKWKTDE
jgi:hypothetical protein